jgi:hypothetical protein
MFPSVVQHGDRLSTLQFGAPHPAPCYCKDCDNKRIKAQNAIDSTAVEGPVLYRSQPK